MAPQDAGQARSRRSLLAGALAAGAGLAAGTLGRPSPASAANGDPLTLGAADNTATATTALATTIGDGLSATTGHIAGRGLGLVAEFQASR